jgi:hypothetical protein
MVRTALAAFALLALCSCSTAGTVGERLEDGTVVIRSDRQARREQYDEEIGKFLTPLLGTDMHNVRVAFQQRFGNDRVCNRGHATATKVRCTFFCCAGRGEHDVVLFFSAGGLLLDWEVRN